MARAHPQRFTIRSRRVLVGGRFHAADVAIDDGRIAGVAPHGSGETPGPVEDLPQDVRGDLPPRAMPAETGVAAMPGTPGASTAMPAAGTLREFKDAAERAYLVQKLRENSWNISKTAEVIDTPRSNLYKKLEQYGISQEKDG
jgi:DNA-binding NtrC family response regulator